MLQNKADKYSLLRIHFNKQIRYSKIIEVLSISRENYRYRKRIWYNIEPRYRIESISIWYWCFNISIENDRTSIIISKCIEILIKFDIFQYFIEHAWEYLKHSIYFNILSKYIDRNRHSQAWSIYFNKISKYIDCYIEILNTIEKRYPYTLIWSIYFDNCIEIYLMLYRNPVHDREKVSIQS